MHEPPCISDRFPRAALAAMIHESGAPKHDDGHTDCYYAGLLAAALPHLPAYTPVDRDWTVHPGELLRERLEELAMPQTYLAMATGYTPKHINQVVQGHKPISVEMALRLERELDTPAHIWVRLQADHDLHVARARGESQREGPR